MTLPEKIYLDNSLLIRWFLWKLNPRRYRSEPEIVKFLAQSQGMQIYISIISLAELVHTLKYSRDFQRFRMTLPWLRTLLEELQRILGFLIIERERIGGVDIGGIVITPAIVRFLDVHPELMDCLHVDIARRNDLWFITHDDNVGKLKPLYENIMTDNKLIRQG